VKLKPNFDIRVSFWRLTLVACLLMVPSLAPIVRGGAATEAPAAPLELVATAAAADLSEGAANTAEVRADAWLDSSIGTMERSVFAMALTAAEAAIERGDVANPKTLTVIDFSRPSTAKRLWVVDLGTRELLYEELVAHGRASGANYATQFSNVLDSNRSSLGLFRTAEAYVGSNGYSLRLDGLERGINDRARERAIVIHGAPYVSEAVAKAQGRIGRSLGCPALRPEVTRELIDTVKGGDLVFAYYPDEQWLSSSRYLGDAVAAD
jgi:hypothetical protein